MESLKKSKASQTGFPQQFLRDISGDEWNEYSDKAIAGIDGKECLAVQPSKQKAGIQQEIATAPMSDRHFCVQGQDILCISL